MSYRIEHSIVSEGYDGVKFWAQARGGAIPPSAPGADPTVVVTAQPTLRSGSDVFYGLSEWRSTDLGASWDGPLDHSEQLGRRENPDGTIVGICDMTPGYHAASGTLLSTGHTVFYADDKHPMKAVARRPAYSAYDAASRSWTPWQALELPPGPAFENGGSGSTQRYDEADGTILLPIYNRHITDNAYKASYQSTILRCAFDGQTLTILEHGPGVTNDIPRGLYEPSITKHGDRYLMTMRNDHAGYVATSTDGLEFGAPKIWHFDDGSELGNYNTQQHWVNHSDALYLVYTRRGLDNDNAFRHRAPLVMAQVDPDRLVVIRETEQILVPNRGARLGNFAVCHVSPQETWVVVAEWMQPVGCEDYGSNNRIWATRLIWDKANAYA